MNAERLLQLYDRIAEAPDAVSRLRRFVLDLAVRGKLVEQDPEDEPASELLERIGAEKARLIKEGQIKQKKRVSQIVPNELSVDVPCGWSAARLGDIAVCLDYKRKPINGAERKRRVEGKSPDQLYPYFGATQQVGWIDDYLFDEELVLLGEDGVPFFDPFRHKAYLISGKTWVNNHAHVFKGMLVSHPYLIHCLNVFDYTGRVVGATRSKLNQARALDIPLPLPPLAEQHRIVAKVDELMTLCNHLEETHNTRETTRDRLTTATLTRLSAPDTDNQSFRTHAHFALDTIPTLTAHPDQIKNLRQTILNLAVRGKLVEQDPTDKPPMALDAGIAGEVDIPFSIPEKWRWCRLKALGELKGGGTPSKTRDDYWGGEIPWVSPKDMKVDYIQRTQLQITETAVTESAANLIEVESLLFVVRGMILAHSFPVAITEVPVATNQDMKALVFRRPEMANYVLRALKGLKPEMLAHVKRSSHGTCRIEADDYRDFLIPIPPQAEQGRIAAKVDELMVLCDQLETSLTKADMMRSHLLNSLLQEALKPAAEDLEAA